MDLMLLRTFQRQVFLQCQFMMHAAQDLNCGLRDGNVRHTYYAIQNLLNASANISKSLWGQRGKLAFERKPLRDSIGIDDDSPLRQVTMRNNFEHIDERIDTWWKQSTHHNHADLNLGPRNMISGIQDIDRFRHFDPTTTDLFFWGQEFNLQVLINEVQKILPKIQNEASKPHWDQSQMERAVHPNLKS